MKNPTSTEIHLTQSGVQRIRIWGRNLSEHLAGVDLYQRIAQKITEINSILIKEKSPPLL